MLNNLCGERSDTGRKFVVFSRWYSQNEIRFAVEKDCMINSDMTLIDHVKGGNSDIHFLNA